MFLKLDGDTYLHPLQETSQWWQHYAFAIGVQTLAKLKCGLNMKYSTLSSGEGMVYLRLVLEQGLSH